MMRISQNNCAVHLLTDEGRLNFEVHDKSHLFTPNIEAVKSDFRNERSLFLDRVEFITRSTYESFLLKLKDIYRVVNVEPYRGYGTLVVPQYANDSTTFFYNLLAEQKNATQWRVAGSVFTFYSNPSYPWPVLQSYIAFAEDGSHKYIGKDGGFSADDANKYFVDVIHLFRHLNDPVFNKTSVRSNTYQTLSGIEYCNATQTPISIIEYRDQVAALTP